MLQALWMFKGRVQLLSCYVRFKNDDTAAAQTLGLVCTLGAFFQDKLLHLMCSGRLKPRPAGQMHIHYEALLSAFAVVSSSSAHPPAGRVLLLHRYTSLKTAIQVLCP
jgi:hypothetical protein